MLRVKGQLLHVFSRSATNPTDTVESLVGIAIILIDGRIKIAYHSLSQSRTALHRRQDSVQLDELHLVTH